MYCDFADLGGGSSDFWVLVCFGIGCGGFGYCVLVCFVD